MDTKPTTSGYNGHVREPGERRGAKRRERMEEAKEMMRPIVERGGRYLETLESRLRTQPWLAVTLGAGGVMVAGAIFGSRLGRTALLVGCGYALHEVFNHQDIARFSHDVAMNAGSSLRGES